MLQEWKRKGKKFRHVEKDGEETTELSVKIRAAKFRDLPMSLRILIVNLSLFLILCAVFFMAGAYLYAPQAAGRNYVEACRQETGTVHTMYASSRTARFCRGRTTSMQ